jgi:hypothetical protein
MGGGGQGFWCQGRLAEPFRHNKKPFALSLSKGERFFALAAALWIN